VRSREPVAAAVAGLLPRGCAAPPAAPPTRRTAASSSCPRGPSPPLPRPPAGPLIGAGKGATVVSNGAATTTVSEIRRRRRRATVGRVIVPLPRARRQAPPLQPRVRAGGARQGRRCLGRSRLGTRRAPAHRGDGCLQCHRGRNCPLSVVVGGGGGFLEEQYVDQMIEELVDSNFSMEIPREVA